MTFSRFLHNYSLFEIITVCCHGEGELRIYLFSHQGIADLLILPEVRALTSNERNTLLKSQEGVLLVIMFVNICSQSAQKAN